MLILSRKPNDSFLIEVEGQKEVIEIKITECANGQVRLGITAPQSCRIWRKELYQTVQFNRQAAVELPASSLRQVISGLSGEEGKTSE
ncbi:MAG: carbon storage regulator [Oscillospiraceae bacterium]|jgi:carbon storage regulator CsrA|nr:carbon storage regulator [Oscillospiraceae bacterium]